MKRFAACCALALALLIARESQAQYPVQHFHNSYTASPFAPGNMRGGIAMGSGTVNTWGGWNTPYRFNSSYIEVPAYGGRVGMGNFNYRGPAVVPAWPAPIVTQPGTFRGNSFWFQGN